MSEIHDSELVEVVENGVSNDLHLASPQDDAKTTENGQVEISDDNNGVVSSVEDSDKDVPNDAKLDEGGKEDMFVDCPDELVIPDHKEPFSAFENQDESEENDYDKEVHPEESNSGGPVTDDLVTLRIKLEKAIKEKEISEREYKEERDNLANERAHFEGTVRELQEQLSKKDQEIEDLHSMVNNVTSEQKQIEAVSNSLLASLVAEAYDGRFSNDPVITKLSHVERSASLLVEYYNHFMSEANLLNQCLNEVRPDLVMQDDFGKTFASTRELLVELKRNEVDLCQKISNLDEENKLLLAKLDQINEGSQNLKAEFEQEKTKFANTKEKLSMAVTRGKALVQQRDSLKQSLAEKSNELEKCTSELQQKTIELEASERTKEELVKCENLAAKLQDALELKDNILADCEGMLSEGASSELDQSINITERVRLLVNERNSMKGLKIEFNKLNDILSRINMPETVLTSDLESRVNWLMESIDGIAQTRETAQTEIERLSVSFLAESQEKNLLYDELQELTFRYQVAVEKEHQASQDKNQMVNMLIEGAGITTDDLKDVSMSPFDITRLIDLCFGKVKEIGVSVRSLDHDADFIERMQTLLYTEDVELALLKLLLEEDVVDKSQVIRLSDKLEAITGEFQALDVERSSLKKDLVKAEDKSTLLREKLSMAVKKGKGLVQERENLKQLIEEKNAEIEKLKLNSQQQESELDSYKEEIDKLSTVTAQIPKLETDLMDAKHQKDEIEKFLVESNTMIQRMIVAIDDIVLPVDSAFKEPAEKLKCFADYLKDCQAEKALAEEELAKLNVEANSLTIKLTESERSMKALEEAVALADNNYSQLVGEKKELEISKLKMEQELQKVLEEASTEASKSEEISISLRDALNCRINAEAEVEEVREELSIQTSKLSEAYRTIKSLEDALFQAETNLSLLAEENNKAQEGRSSVENEMRKLTEEADSQVNKFADACLRMKSLEDSLLKADSSINELSSAKEIAEEEILALKAKLKTCMEELDGVHNRVESRSLALSDDFENLQALLENDRLTIMFRKSFTNKYENLKQINLLIEGIKDQLIRIESKTALSVKEVDLDISKFNEVLDNIANVEVDNEGETADGDNKESYHNTIVEKFHLRQNTLENTFETLSSFVDEFLAALLTKLQVTRDEVLLVLDNNVSLKDKMFHLEKERDEHEKIISALENETAVLLSACTNVTQKLEMEIENSVQEQNRNTLPANADNFSSKENDVDEHASEDHMHSDSINIKTAERMFEKVRALCENFDNERERSNSIITGLQNKLVEITGAMQNAAEERDLNQTWASRYESELEDLKRSYKGFGDERELSTNTTKELQNELAETKRALENAVEERDLNQNRASKLESDLEALHKSCKQFSDEKDLSVSRISELHDELMETRKALEAASEERDLNLRRTSQLESDLEALHKSCKQFSEENDLSVSRISELHDELMETRRALEAASEERDLNLHRTSQLEAKLGELEKACNHFADERELSTAMVNELQNEVTQAKLALEIALKERDLCQTRVSNLESELEVLKDERELSDANINALQSKLTKMDRSLENTIQDRDLHQSRTSKLENDIEDLEMSCKEMKLKLVEYEEERTLKEREVSVSLLHDTVISDEVARDILEKVNAIEIPVTDIKEGYNTQTQDNTGLVKKLFNILDSVDEMQHQINLLSHDKEELQLALASKVDEEEEYIKENRELDKMKAEFLGLAQGLDNIIQKLGGDMQPRDQKITDLRGLVSTLENLVITVIEESESLKFKSQELGVRFLANQGLVDELSSKLKSLEDSNRYRSSSPEVVQERKILEAPPLPTRSEITEIEDGVGLVAKKVVSSSVPSAAHSRTLRKGSNDHLVINMDTESEQLINNEETTEDKGHIFKSLNTSGLVPKQGKLIADRVDGIWVSGSRALMNHPKARLGVVAYWLFLHLWMLGTIIL
ncbi:trans-Golgi network-localized SYP41-interacting protein 1 [Impatiens glandulifera]|uniref:trans-Golgi network-localized SYP41-interacting protein 1 n=1 Tax=Impatiens glandulifera TaxID=253017 RepID=UPI001FB162E7|nr:trans-Golgi network-localized SYP41-interacting protein 1 [Impatiens glandulifera]XP_047318945.1 trans-Golgi network-localized SYP41-interacting protein 1 [Impatiens glandulifera]